MGVWEPALLKLDDVEDEHRRAAETGASAQVVEQRLQLELEHAHDCVGTVVGVLARLEELPDLRPVGVSCECDEVRWLAECLRVATEKGEWRLRSGDPRCWHFKLTLRGTDLHDGHRVRHLPVEVPLASSHFAREVHTAASVADRLGPLTHSMHGGKVSSASPVATVLEVVVDEARVLVEGPLLHEAAVVVQARVLKDVCLGPLEQRELVPRAVGLRSGIDDAAGSGLADGGVALPARRRRRLVKATDTPGMQQGVVHDVVER